LMEGFAALAMTIRSAVIASEARQSPSLNP